MRLKNEDLLKAEQVKAVLDRDYNKHYTYRQLVLMVGINKLALQIAFKALTQLNVYQYLTKVRMENAIYFLENTQLTINEIAHKIGLHKSNFTRQFKKHTNKTPSEWRRKEGIR
jgi:AraC-like DNA-binding protein